MPIVLQIKARRASFFFLTFEAKLEPLKKAIASIIFWIFGWKAKVNLTDDMKHSVMIAAPHTSNWDFPIALMAFWKMEVPVRYFIKDYYTKGILGWFFKWTGAIGVNRSKEKNHLTNFAIEQLKSNKELIILVTPEGSRKRAEKWRTGFYRIAKAANVPICLAYVDFPDKVTGIREVFQPSEDFETDMEYIQNAYSDYRGKFPENFNPKIY